MTLSKNNLNDFNLPSCIHQAVLDPHVSTELLKSKCDEAKELNFSGFCIHSNQIATARKRLGQSGKTKLISVIAFPFGSIPTMIKKHEAEWAAEKGAEEIDLVPNFSALSQNNSEIFAEEIALICEVGLPTRVILDCNNLSITKLNLAINASIEAGAIGIQTGNGFGRSITIDDVNQFKNLVKARCEIKAVGGIKTLEKALELLNGGANSLGTSFGPKLIKELKNYRQ